MKKILILILLLNISTATAQLLPGGGKDAYESSSKKNKQAQYFTALIFKSPKMIDLWALELGLKFGGNVSKNFAIAVEYNSIISKNIKIEIPDYPYIMPIFRMSHFGVSPEYTLPIFPMISVNGKITIGMGYSSYSTHNDVDVLSDLDGDWFGVIEPAVGFDVFTSPGISLNAQAGWRFCKGVDYQRITDEDLSGPVFILGLKAYVF